jgi:hypothetical protein
MRRTSDAEEVTEAKIRGASLLIYFTYITESLNKRRLDQGDISCMRKFGMHAF